MYRAYHALPPLKHKEELVNAVYGFFLIFTKALDDIDPDFAITVFDRKEKTFRHEIFEDYKSQRPDMPEGLVSQISLIKEGLGKFKVPVIDQKGYEADDIIATLACRWKKEFKIIILSGDRDLLQLVDNNVIVKSPGRGIKKMINFDKEKVIEKYGIPPSLFVDYKALRGDPSDNIPGIKGIGKKRASELVKTYGNIKDIYSSFEELKDSFKEKLNDKKEEVLMNKKLVSLVCDMDLDADLKKAKIDYQKEEVLNFFKEFNFKSLVKKYDKGESQMKLEL